MAVAVGGQRPTPHHRERDSAVQLHCVFRYTASNSRRGIVDADRDSFFIGGGVPEPIEEADVNRAVSMEKVTMVPAQISVNTVNVLVPVGSLGVGARED